VLYPAELCGRFAGAKIEKYLIKANGYLNSGYVTAQIKKYGR
jgi:hypothetical protein